jgi:phospholipase C
MTDQSRREFLRMAAETAAVVSLFPPVIQKALAIPAATRTGTLQDVGHVVILMLENRSFDHYFGTLRGVRGFGDRHLVPLASGKPIWHQSDGQGEILPFHLDTRTTSAMRVPDMPHTFSDAQAAWGQGRYGLWPRFKTPYSMGYYRREDIPFQFALAEAFTICDAYHCSITGGTDPNRIVFFSGSNFNPQLQAQGLNCTDADAEVNNLRCAVSGRLPSPGYRYAGSPFRWTPIPELLEVAGISWRIYQDPNNNWTGLMHGGLAFEAFRTATPGSPLYEKGMRHSSLEDLARDAKSGNLPQVSWILPPQEWSEHPAPSSPLQGAEFTIRVLDALTADPEVWSKTVLFVLFDENDGLFDHVPPPAPPSYNPDGTPAGKSTLDLAGEYFSDPARKYADPGDSAVGTLRPWGLGPRVPLYAISPWSRGGWVNSQVFDHTSVGQFLEKRFGIVIRAISPWHRAVCGDLTTVFDFRTPNDQQFPELPRVGDLAAVLLDHIQRSDPWPPKSATLAVQESGMRPSRALPYELHVHVRAAPTAQALNLEFRNTGAIGAVFHVYNRLQLDAIPRRYTVQAGKALMDTWQLNTDTRQYDLWVCGPNGFVREFRWTLDAHITGFADIDVRYDPVNLAIDLIVLNASRQRVTFVARANAYRSDGPWPLSVSIGQREARNWSLVASHGWYDFTVAGEAFEHRFAGRMESGAHSFSDPAV